MKFKEKIAWIPLSINGVALGSLGVLGIFNTLLMKLNTYDDLFISGISLLISSIILLIATFYFILMFFKFIFTFEIFKKEMKDLKSSSFVATFFLTSLAYANALAHISRIIFQYDAIALNKALILPNIIYANSITIGLLYFGYFFIKVFCRRNYFKNDIYGAFCVPLFGVAVSCCYYNNFGNIIPSIYLQILWIFTAVLFAIIWPFIIFKLIIRSNQEETMIPSQAMVISPPNMLGYGFFVIFASKNNHYFKFINNKFYLIISTIFLIIGILSIFAYILAIHRTRLIKSNKLTWAAFTFPFIIHILFLYSYNEKIIYLIANYYWLYCMILNITVLLWIAQVIFVFYLNILHFKHLHNLFNNKKTEYQRPYFFVNNFKIKRNL
ncbi:C4-dicarboxylate transporter/malic acid transport protein [Metamycoplasma cloacale]|uniref:Uncharacterized protein n=1 Tax=Metamycoplasma cloacale TaxID=92401 RepID=A0A2Z4LM69_9BACT|nr:hypothetical protein [Metamycoplasma cloacale]AWX42863.1 hypothetical protein DK849_02205 [Metamycoplasma cloacale]VEU79315.1 C4-dicarboxylate transporter/malic acid transport protein [Metamycoplasma cloacale]